MKTTHEVLLKHVDKEQLDALSENLWKDLQDAMKEYAKQALEEALERVKVVTSTGSGYVRVDKQSIINIIKELK